MKQFKVQVELGRVYGEFEEGVFSDEETGKIAEYLDRLEIGESCRIHSLSDEFGIARGHQNSLVTRIA